jgi:signal transduction histidine kinase
MDPRASRVLEAIVEAIGDAQGYDAVLRRICRAVVEALPCDQATVYTWSKRRQEYLPRADHGTPTVVIERFLRRGFSYGRHPVVAELSGGRTFLVAEGASPTPAMRELLDNAELSSLLGVPLIYDGQPEGALFCGGRGARVLDSGTVDALRHVAPHVALLIRNARLETETARLAARRTWLASCAASILGAPDVLDVATLLDEAGRELFHTGGAWLLLCEEDALVGLGVRGPARGTEVIRIPLTDRTASTDALRARRILVVNEYADSPYAPAAAGAGFRPASVLVAPLADEAGPLGVLMLHDAVHPRRFGATDEEDARLLAAIATAALRKLFLVRSLTRANHAKSDFLASVSHDLRTPLNIITGYAQLLQEETFGPVTPEQGDALGRIQRTVSDQVGLINDLLDLARIEQGALRCQHQPVPLATLVPPLQDMMTVLLRGRPIRFEAEVPADVVAVADPERMRQVLVNLLANAAKFTNEGCVRLVAESRGTSVGITVSDTGPGIEASVRERVLEPFVRGSSPQAGSGLGLAIVVRLLRAMGGELAIDSAAERGTRVSISLPAA